MHKVLVAAVAAVALTTPAFSGENIRGVTDNEIVIGTYTDLSGVTAVWCQRRQRLSDGIRRSKRQWRH